MPQKQLHLGAILSGVGTARNDWLAPGLPGDALRGHLGLPYPVNRHASLRIAAE